MNIAPSCDVPMPNAIMNATIVETAMVAAGDNSAKEFILQLPPTSQLITAPASGAKIIMLKRLFSTIYLLVRTLSHGGFRAAGRELAGFLTTVFGVAG